MGTHGLWQDRHWNEESTRQRLRDNVFMTPQVMFFVCIVWISVWQSLRQHMIKVCKLSRDTGWLAETGAWGQIPFLHLKRATSKVDVNEHKLTQTQTSKRCCSKWTLGLIRRWQKVFPWSTHVRTGGPSWVLAQPLRRVKESQQNSNVLGPKLLISPGLSDDLKHDLTSCTVAKDTSRFWTISTSSNFERCAENCRETCVVLAEGNGVTGVSHKWIRLGTSDMNVVSV